MSRLQFANGKTLHSWSGYGDGHKPVDELIGELEVSAVHENTRQNILQCDTLILDEVGMISSHMMECVDKICKNIRNSSCPMGGIQLIAAGSFVQLPPVPSTTDPGKYAFEWCHFRNLLPHRINLKIVHRQKEQDLINAINTVCEGESTAHTHRFLRSFKRPLQSTDLPVHIFGTNYDVDFFNIMTLQKLNGNEVVYTAQDTPITCNFLQRNVPKNLPLKIGCSVIVVRNLETGLVNGISAQVEQLNEDSVVIKVNADRHLNHSMQGRLFTITQYSFFQRNSADEITAIRRQLPLKLGYAITVDKAQGRTLDQVVIDATNFWRPGQFGVTIGRATCKDGLQILKYNEQAAELKHPQIVQDLYKETSYLMKQNLSCCNASGIAKNVVNYGFHINVPPMPQLQQNLIPNPKVVEHATLQDFPFDVTEYTSELISTMPQVTDLQKDLIKLLRDNAKNSSFIEFLSKANSNVTNIFITYRTSTKKTKCNWCRMCSHLHTFFGSEDYKKQMKQAFNSDTLRKEYNTICTRIYFNLLERCASKEANDIRKQRMENYIEQSMTNYNMDALDTSSLRYIAGACIHSVKNYLANLSLNQIMSHTYKAQVNHRKQQLTSKLIGPPSKIEMDTIEPQSLIKLLAKDTGGLLYVTDECFTFFKLLLLTVKKHQNFKSIQYDPENVFSPNNRPSIYRHSISISMVQPIHHK